MTIPNSIGSNTSGLAFAEEASLKVLPGSPIWYGLEPNTYTDLGAKFTTIKRRPITNTRQTSKGTITDLEAPAGFQQDLTPSNLTRLMQGFFWADAKEKPSTNPVSTAGVAVTSVATGVFNIASGGAAFLAGHLIFASGFGVLANNGLKVVSGSTGTSVSTSSTVAAEASPPANKAMIEVCGYQGASGDLVLAMSGIYPQLTSTTLDFTTLGFNVGEWIYIGGDAAGNAFATAGDTGYARISVIAAHALTFDETSFTPLADAGTGKTIRIFFGKVLVNASAATGIKRRTYTIERQMGNDGTAIQAEYVLGAIPNDFSINIKANDKVTVDLSFVGMTVQENDGTTGIMTGTRVDSPHEGPFNTSHDVFMTRLFVLNPATLNPTALYGYADDIKIDIKNNVSPNKAVGVLGAFEASTGDFEVGGTIEAYFQSVDAVNSIKANADVSLATILARANAGMVFDIPLLQLGGGIAKVEKDKPIKVSLTQDAAQNPLGYTFLATVFPYLPTVAMPV